MSGVNGTTEPHVKVELLSDPRYLSGARELVSAVSRRLGFDEITCCQIALAVDEALANVICHGYERRPDGKIWLFLWPGPENGATDGGIRVIIEDEAKQVDLDLIKSRDLDDVRPGGLGVHIIQEVMDEVRYEKREERGMRVFMMKRAGRGGGPADGGGAGAGEPGRANADPHGRPHGDDDHA